MGLRTLPPRTEKRITRLNPIRAEARNVVLSVRGGRLYLKASDQSEQRCLLGRPPQPSSSKDREKD